MSATLAQAQQIMSSYGLSIFYILGTIGNFLLICIFLQPTHRRNPCSLYLLATAIVNFILIQCVLPLSVYSAYHTDPQNVSMIWCKIRSYLFNSLLMIYRWNKTAACIDRAAMCSRYVRIRAFSHVRIARRIIFIIIFVWVTIPVHLAVYFRIESGHCMPSQTAYAKFFSFYSIAVSGWSPALAMAIFGIIAYRNLKMIRANVHRLDHADRMAIDRGNNLYQQGLTSKRIGQRDQQSVLLLVCEVVLYICTNLLYSINITYSAITADISKSVERIAIEWFIAYISTPFLVIINNCAPFYLYLFVSSRFRQDVKRFLTKCCYTARVVPQPGNLASIAARQQTR
ncbi:unnamed protein product [Adineta ricciae]|uniref:G-protein coupled receptors family 1 profile domain-containing protein n=1 Tax=Adineta ricciae TaxID=249248 RepID=A0A813UFE1_ADIRI|nr:unnamed protein product [Adineta ricciae]CAF1301817.1 unnamed protein product [Adineta ricciae]